MTTASTLARTTTLAIATCKQGKTTAIVQRPHSIVGKLQNTLWSRDLTRQQLQTSIPSLAPLHNMDECTSALRNSTLGDPGVDTSGLHKFIAANKLPESSPHTPHAHRLALQVAHNLRFQQGWTGIRLHYQPCLYATAKVLPRPVISGIPPKRLYVHPDEQIELLQRQRDQGKAGWPEVAAEREWVVSTQLREAWTLRRFAEVFDALAAVPPEDEGGKIDFEAKLRRSHSIDGKVKVEDEGSPEGLRPLGRAVSVDREIPQAAQNPWRTGQPKRMLLATLDDDSTVVYYVVHDGLVKPRQN